MNVTRRQLLRTTAVAASLAAAGRLPLLAAAPSGSAIDRNLQQPCSVKPIRSHLRNFTPTTARIPADGPYRLTYDIIHWAGGTTADANPANPTIGRLTITRTTDNAFQIAQTTAIGGVQNVISATINCDSQFPCSITNWTLQRHSTTADRRVDPISKISEEGSCSNNRILIDNGTFKYGFDCRTTLLAQWLIPAVLADHNYTASELDFTLLQDLSLCKPSQHLTNSGKVIITVKAARKVELTAHAQTGQGILPTHYLRDDTGLTHLVTSAMISWALTDCAPA